MLFVSRSDSRFSSDCNHVASLYLFVSNSIQFKIKKEGWGGGGSRNIVFSRGQGELVTMKPAGKALTITIGDGLPKNSSKFPCITIMKCCWLQSVLSYFPQGQHCVKRKRSLKQLFHYRVWEVLQWSFQIQRPGHVGVSWTCFLPRIPIYNLPHQVLILSFCY